MANLDVGGASLHFEVEGRGEPVLFIQGVGVAGSGWRPQVEVLGKDFECLTFDNRGIGKSQRNGDRLTIERMAADAIALLDPLGWRSAHVAGHSMGGLIAQEVALQAPARVRTLSLLCTFSKGPEAARLTPWVIWMSLRTRIGTRPMRRQAFLEMLFPDPYLRSMPAESLAARLAPIIGRDLADQPSVMLEQVQAMAKYDRSARLSELSGIPTVVASAEFDPIAKPEYGRHLSALIPGAGYVEIREASHGVTIQRVQRVNELLREQFSCA